MKVRFLGSGDAFGSGGRFQTCIYVEAAGGRFLVDCGASSLVAMRRFGVDPLDVDTVLLTHLHGDHFAGVPFLILDAQFKRRTRPLTVAGPPGVEARVRDAMEVLFPGSTRVERRFATRFVAWSERTPLALGACTVTPYEVVHASGAPPFALRIACDGKVLTYSGDTEWTASLADAARGADLFVAEALFFDKPIKYHLDFKTLMAHRAELECGRLVLTHMGEDVLARLPALGVEGADDGQTVEL
ncbi:MAG: MBL fold metallo-hydrolase [Candidatus Rokubacteria bacterium RIFCSPHIGHO2_12_FULL_73_22]|nr:MAG: MBL fold metallo-hydrolase [Candidatus Rokubacteria bacterium RIFCSPHIGHO2_02_FULL_73_26]OGL00771.1 MAG: MBL fold metallo-hydrolase [Candidatus Rokubacteria bacterium RIFCSPHIGHO2_12_FULL_73_22]OGL12450.1 MAG: MBL fold metallo-hydrolase [Candidatus Rokubacteria bacterium RIFCSPLOWO2_02_FULL_73_56]OGL26105.1 MAG: MBL fold metallo-hydrolase [Candidatus Rokubacteria bacterium RIFCSPLOWO2_12_FULL_73_47]